MCGIEDLIKSTGVIAITLHLHYTDLFFPSTYKTNYQVIAYNKSGTRLFRPQVMNTYIYRFIDKSGVEPSYLVSRTVQA